jgi:hypothetical protein
MVCVLFALYISSVFLIFVNRDVLGFSFNCSAIIVAI